MISEDPTKILRVKDPWRSWQELWKSSNDLWKLFEDLPNSCQDLQGSFILFKDHAKNFKDPWKIFKNSLRILKILDRFFEDLSFPAKSLKDLDWIFKDLDKNFENPQVKLFEDPSNSCQDLQGSFILSRDHAKNFKDPWKIFENSLRILKILDRFFEDLSFPAKSL